jgi:uncharacterized protein YndB with AHSA1/START domain
VREEELERITITRRIRAQPEHVYRFFTDPVLWARWQGTAASVDPRPGGGLRVVMGPGGSGVAEGRFLELEPFVRIVFTWGWASSPLSTLPPGSTVVTVQLRPDGDGTLVTLTHDGLPAGERDLHAAGWSIYLDRLVLVVEGIDPGPDPSLDDPGQEPSLRGRGDG